MFRIAGDLGKDNLIQVQGDRYEGLTVWVNSMVASAGTTIVEPDDPEQVALAEGPTDTALGTMGELANSPYADSSLSTSTEDSARLSFESGNSAFMLNYPFVYPSAKENAPEVFKNLAAARYPRVVADIPSAPPLGGINLGVSAFSKKQDQAFDAIKCLVQPDNQLEIASAAGLPPVVESVYRSREIEKVYPGFADLMRESIKAAAPRPVTPAYQDLTLAIQRVVHPVADIDPDDPGPTTEELRDKVETALKREGLL
jgi:multiple sugar transport system substrate-binding protein